MYSERIVNDTCEDYERRNGWLPQPHSIGEVDEFVAYIDSITEFIPTKGGRAGDLFWRGKAPSAERVKWIRRFIQNEQYMSFASAEYFVTRYGRIRTADERIIHFEFRLGQKIFLSILAECDDRQMAIQLFCLKARQVGISTGVALFFLHRILFRSNTYAVMASVQQKQSDKLNDIIDTTWSRLPFWLPPAKTVLKAREPKWANGSRLSIQSGSQEVGIEQGSSPSCVHISETGYYTNAKKVLDEGLFPACHQFSTLFMVLEGTGSLETVWQKETWDYAVENWGKPGKNARFRPIFIPPCCAKDLYPPPDWSRTNPIPDRWEPIEETHRMRRRAELYVRSQEYLRKFLGNHWEMDREFQWFWECGYKEAVAKHTEREFISQNSPTPDDAYQSPNDRVFSKEVIEIVTKNKAPAYKAYAVTGRSILIGNENVPYQPDRSMVDDTERNIDLHWEAPDGNTYDWTLVPLKEFDDSTDDACFDKLLIFEAPEANEEYAIAIDTAHGLNQPNEDRGCLRVHIHKHGEEANRQVASFTSLRVNSPQMARIAAAIAVLYGTDGGGNVISADPLIAKFVIEQVRKPGDECQHQLKIMGFFHHHIMHRYDSKGNIDPSKGTQEGWYTRNYTRSILLDRYVDAVNTGWIILNDPISIRELSDFERRYRGNGQSEMIACSGSHDDALFADAMAWTTLTDLENTALRLQRRYQAPARAVQHEDGWCERVMSID